MKEFAFDATAKIVLRVSAETQEEAENAVQEKFNCVELASIELDEAGIRISEASLSRIEGMFEEEVLERPEYIEMLYESGCPVCLSENTYFRLASINGVDGVEACICDECGHTEEKYK